MYWRIAPLAAGLFLMSVASLQAQDDLIQLYGNGVHAYFSRDYRQSHKLMTTAIKRGSKDPRCYFFRGLACLKTGRPDEAAADFKKGADLESISTHGFTMVSKSLERIQGKARLTLERYRAEGRKLAQKRRQRLRNARYENLRAQELLILQEQAEAAPPPPPEKEATPPPAPKTPAPGPKRTAPAAPAPAPSAKKDGAG
jgi:hypothetical protein